MPERSYCDDETFNYRRGFCDEKVTLDGHPARIFGAALRFAQIERIDGFGGIVEFSWRTVERKLEANEKNFRSN